MFCHNRKPGGIPVQPVDTAEHKGNPLLFEIPCQCIAERILRIPTGWMNRHSCRFVDHKQILILINDGKRQFYRTDLSGIFRFPNPYRQNIPFCKHVVHMYIRSVQADCLFVFTQIYKILLGIPFFF